MQLNQTQRAFVPATTSQTDAGSSPAPNPGDGAFERKAREAAEKFEAHFIAQMLHQMRRSARELSGDDGIFHDRVNDDMLDMTDTLMADSLASRHAFGIADVILRQLLPAAQGNAGDEKTSFNSQPKTVALDR